MPAPLALSDGFELLKRYEIPTCEYALVREPFELSKIDFAFPWVMKLSSDKILHKTEQKAVHTHVQTKQQAASVLAQLRTLDPNAPVVVQPMLDGTELFIGSTVDLQFGPTIVAGIGGVNVELLKDTRLRILPIKMNDALDLLDELAHQEVLDGFRGKPAVNRRKFGAILLKTAKMIETEKTTELDLNPLIATKNGIYAVDCRIVK
jgi:acetyltransferase